MRRLAGTLVGEGEPLITKDHLQTQPILDGLVSGKYQVSYIHVEVQIRYSVVGAIPGKVAWSEQFATGVMVFVPAAVRAAGSICRKGGVKEHIIGLPVVGDGHITGGIVVLNWLVVGKGRLDDADRKDGQRGCHQGMISGRCGVFSTQCGLQCAVISGSYINPPFTMFLCIV